jgi:hypothetical protein
MAFDAIGLFAKPFTVVEDSSQSSFQFTLTLTLSDAAGLSPSSSAGFDGSNSAFFRDIVQFTGSAVSVKTLVRKFLTNLNQLNSKTDVSHVPSLNSVSVKKSRIPVRIKACASACPLSCGTQSAGSSSSAHPNVIAAPSSLQSVVTKPVFQCSDVSSAAPSTAAAVCEPNSFQDLLKCAGPDANHAALLDRVEADKSKNRELARFFYVLNPPSLSGLSDVLLVQKILKKLDFRVGIISVHRVVFRRAEAIAVELDKLVSSSVCARFRQFSSVFRDCFPNVVLKARRSLLLSFAMFRMFRTCEYLRDVLHYSVQVDRGWFVRIGGLSPLSPYDFLRASVVLESGESVRIRDR